jgi:hypothetical protein
MCCEHTPKPNHADQGAIRWLKPNRIFFLLMSRSASIASRDSRGGLVRTNIIFVSGASAGPVVQPIRKWLLRADMALHHQPLVQSSIERHGNTFKRLAIIVFLA